MIIEGAIATKTALLNQKREVFKVYIDKDKKDRNTAFIKKIAKDKVISIDRDKIDALAKTKTHGGIIAECSFRDFDDLDKDLADIVIIDGIEDPFNLGYMFRTMMAFGYKEVIMPKRDLKSMENTILKSSAGAFDMLRVVMSEDLKRDVEALKNDHEIIALARSPKAVDLLKYTLPKRKVLIVGGEKRGIKKDLQNLCDIELFIPYFSDFRPALNASSALAAVLMSFRQKEK